MNAKQHLSVILAGSKLPPAEALQAEIDLMVSGPDVDNPTVQALIKLYRQALAFKDEYEVFRIHPAFEAAR